MDKASVNKNAAEETAMVKAAFCDDDIGALGEMQAFLDRYRKERGARFDVLFLDILMPGENGLEAAAEIRDHDRNVKIIFLTSSSEFAVKAYEVEAYFYQLKPLRWESFSHVMDSVLEQCEREMLF